MRQLIRLAYTLCFLLLATNISLAQGFSINTTGASANASAMLDLTSTSKGVLLPRMTGAQKWAISSPATGLMVFQTDSTSGFYYYTGSTWNAVGGGSPAGAAGGDLTGTYPSPTLTTSGVTAGTYGSTTTSPQITVDAKGRVTSVTNQTIAGGMPSGTAVGQMLYWNGTAWVAITAGSSGQTLVLTGSTPTWTNMPLSLSVGMAYGGGIVAYILAPGDPGYDAHNQHGLIAAVSDQSTGIQWLNSSYTTVGSTSYAIGTGLANTVAIIANQGAGSYAASLAKGYTGGGYTDWYLPSKDELNKLYINRIAIGNFAIAGYWSSSEVDYWAAIYEYFGSGGQYGDYKVGLFYVRAVRSF